MLDEVHAVRYQMTMKTGRTKPCVLTCQHEDGTEIELVAKFKAGCELGYRALINEAIASVLAVDLGLPVPESFIVLVDDAFAEAIPKSAGDARDVVKASVGPNFGTKKLPPSYGTFSRGLRLPRGLVALAGEILAFDVFIVNPDRVPGNPNILQDGNALVIYDHDMAFCSDICIGWKKPWEDDASRHESLRRHVLFDVVRRGRIDLDRLTSAFKCISPNRLEEYGHAIPTEWIGDGAALDRILRYIRELVDNVDEAVVKLTGALA